MIRGISGGQKKRVTTGEPSLPSYPGRDDGILKLFISNKSWLSVGEKLVGPCSTLFMDEISTGKHLPQSCCHPAESVKHLFSLRI